MALISKLTAIAEAIRNKTGKTDLLTLEQMPVEIAAIETGGGSSEGGSGDTGIEDALVSGSLSGVYSNDRVTEVGAYVFYDSDVTSFDLPNVTKINRNAFELCYYITSLSLPKLETVGVSVFASCQNLVEIKLPKIIKTSVSCFISCKALETIILPSVTTMTAGTEFSACTALKKVILPSITELGYTTLYSATFKQCTALEALILPSDTMCTLKSGAGAFGNTSTSYASGISLNTGYIYVPEALLESYKTGTNWSAYQARFRAIEDYPEICAEVLNADGTIKTADEIKAEMEASI